MIGSQVVVVDHWLKEILKICNGEIWDTFTKIYFSDYSQSFFCHFALRELECFDHQERNHNDPIHTHTQC